LPRHRRLRFGPADREHRSQSLNTVGHDLIAGGDWILIILVLLGAVPEVAASWQFLLVAGHSWRHDYDACAPVFPRTAILIPAWNEAAVIGASIDRLMSLEYPRDALHLADPQVGAVTAYIKEGSRPGNYMTRFIGYEYITAQAAARRGQNVLGATACLAGGAQLHTRANLLALGGRIDTTSLAEDTFTTFQTQLNGRRVVFEPHATVWAEEPGSIIGLWKQRLRWARGNVQVTLRYRTLWFRRQRGNHLGSISFGVFWFCLFLQPIFMIVSSISLLTLYFASFPMAWLTFHVLWIINAVTYIFITGFALLIDPQTGRHTWRQGVMFPGVVNLGIVIYTCFPELRGAEMTWDKTEKTGKVTIPT